MSCATNSLNQAAIGDVDNSVDFSGVTVSSGTFGPFGLVTRDSIDGSIVDANYMFGHITILSDITPSTVTVSASDSVSAIGIEE